MEWYRPNLVNNGYHSTKSIKEEKNIVFKQAILVEDLKKEVN